MGQADNRADDTVGPHAAGVLEQVVDDEMIVFSPATDGYFALNRSAREVWELADGTRTATEIAQALADRYEIDAAELEDDVATIVASFAQSKLI